MEMEQKEIFMGHDDGRHWNQVLLGFDGSNSRACSLPLGFTNSPLQGMVLDWLAVMMDVMLLTIVVE